jgi:anthranilate synthase component 1
MIKQDEHLSFRAGAGIVFDSIADRELEETTHKAQGILKVFS